MLEVRIYQITITPNERFICTILEKCYNTGLKTLVKVRDVQTSKTLDANLWTFGRKSFVPHGTESSAFLEQEPIYITHQNKNPNHAAILVCIDIFEKPDVNFEQVVYICTDEEAFELAFEKSTSFAKKISRYKQQGDGKWTNL